MIEFLSPALSDRGWADELLRVSGQRACDYNFANLYLWGPVYGARIARLGGRIAVLVQEPADPAYLWPAGRGDLRDALLALEADAAGRNGPFRLTAVTRGQRAILEGLFPGRFRFREARADFDYLYQIGRLADLTGKKLHAKRNHINQFMRDHPVWSYEEMTPRNLPECLAMEAQWDERSRIREGAGEERDLDNEGRALRRAMRDFVPLGLEGGVLRVRDEVVAFSIGDLLCPDTYDVHFEKAYNEVQGAYTMINRCFARQVRERHPGLSYLNRENDMGMEGLRKAKESYHPDRMVEKYIAVKTG